MVFAFWFPLFAYTASAASAVLGIDLGTGYIKAALVKPGIPLEIVLTKDSKRKESAAVGFKAGKSKANAESSIFPERLYGGDALAVAARFPGDVYSNLKPLLGQLYRSNDRVADFKRRYPGLSLVEIEERSTVGIKSPSFEENEESFLVEELLAMELKNIKRNAQALAGKHVSVRDAVITIPPFYTAEEKAAVALAADLAGVRVLALLNDGLSVGLDYAKSRTFPNVQEGGTPETHLIYDMGAGSATATIIKFNGKTVKDVGKYNKTIQELQVLGTGWDRTFGGDALNQLIVDDMVTKLVELRKMQSLGVEVKHIKEHSKTMAKIWKEAERIRQVLSANSETSASFEGLYYEDVNFKYKLSRSDFEILASTYSGRVKEPIHAALDSAKLKIAEIDSVILFGGAVRTPFVQKQLEAAVGSAEKLKTNVNSDEAAVFGAAFKAAGISPSFRVKEIRTIDSANYGVGVSWRFDGKDEYQKLFTPTSPVGTTKQLPCRKIDDFAFNFYEQVPNNDDIIQDKPIVKVQSLNLTASVEKLVERYKCVKTDIDTIFDVRLSPVNGLPEVLKGSVSCETTAPKGVLDGLKDVFGFGGKKEEQKPIQDDEESTSSSTSLSESTTTSTLSMETQSSESVSSADKSDGQPKEAKKRIETIYLDFTTETVGLLPPSIKQLQHIKDRLAAFDSSDRSRVKREETLNTLEAFTYKARDLLEEEGFVEASTPSHRDTITYKIKSASEWLYGDGAEASRDELKARLEELHALVDPIQMRKEEAVLRPQATKALKEALNQTKTMVDVLKGQVEAMADLSKSTTATESETPAATDQSSMTDDFASLEDLTSASSTTTEAPSSPPPAAFAYSEEDLKGLTDSMADTEEWLNTKIAEQDRLSPSDDPVITASDINSKAKEMNEMMMNVLTKSMKTPPKGKKPNSKASRSPTIKPRKVNSSTTVSEAATTGAPSAEPPADEKASGPSKEQTSKSATSKSKLKSKSTGKKTKTKSFQNTKATPKEEL